MFENAPAIIGVMIPVIALLIPVVAILTRHQQRMVELTQGGYANANTQELAAIRAELRDLRNLVNQQTLALDTLSTRVLTPRPVGESVPTVNTYGS